MSFWKFESIKNAHNILKESFSYLKGDNIEYGWTVTEKLDGSNICACKKLNSDQIELYSRNGLDAREVFKDDITPEIIEKIRTSLKSVEVWFDNKGGFETSAIFVWGEIINTKLLKRTRYGDTPQFFAFRGAVSDTDGGHHTMAFCDLVDSFENIHENAKDYLVPFKNEPVMVADIFKMEKEVDNWHPKSALNSNVNAEGIVLMPNWLARYMPTMKLKTKKFREKISVKATTPREKTISNDPIANLRKEFSLYINDNRIISLQSKGYKFTRENIPTLVKLLLADAIDDFEKDNPSVLEMDKKDRKKIYNIGSYGFNMVRSFVDSI